ncbi:MAG TPA: hypothetical protein PKH43_04000, partial [Saprospiraceae bacterium]|nr:hypothetical protein [Saprospiraceae bacterium]
MKYSLIVCALCLLAGAARARSLYVGAGHMSWRAALAAARPFDTIWVQGGEYREGASIEIAQPMTVIGVDWPLLDGELRYQPLSIRSSYVSVSGLRVANSPSNGLEDYAGIKVYNAHAVYVWGNRLENNYFGIYLSNCVRCVVTGNQLRASGTAEQTSGNGI